MSTTGYILSTIGYSNVRTILSTTGSRNGWTRASRLYSDNPLQELVVDIIVCPFLEPVVDIIFRLLLEPVVDNIFSTLLEPSCWSTFCVLSSVFVNHCLSLCPLFGHCIVCPSFSLDYPLTNVDEEPSYWYFVLQIPITIYISLKLNTLYMILNIVRFK
jgi:hypothetical protein